MPTLKSFGMLTLVTAALNSGDASAAEGPPVLSMHRACVGGAVGEKTFLRYWSPPPDNALSGPVCVAKSPALEGLVIRSARVLPDRRSGVGWIVVVEFDDTAKPLIEKMSRENVGMLMAVVVQDRIVSMPMISRPFADNKLYIGASNDAEVSRILAAVNPGAAGTTR